MVKEKIKKVKKKIQPKQTKPLLYHPVIKLYVDVVHKLFAVVTIDIAVDNFPFICEKYYISFFLCYSKLKPTLKLHFFEKIVQANINYCKKFDLNIKERDKILPIIYWQPKVTIRHQFFGYDLLQLQRTAPQSQSLM